MLYFWFLWNFSFSMTVTLCGLWWLWLGSVTKFCNVCEHPPTVHEALCFSFPCHFNTFACRFIWFCGVISCICCTYEFPFHILLKLCRTLLPLNLLPLVQRFDHWFDPHHSLCRFKMCARINTVGNLFKRT